MGLVSYERESGLLLAEQSASSAHVRHALKRLDPDLVLSCEIDFRWQREVWKVLLRQGDRPALWLFDWRTSLDDPSSEPRPLTMGIVEEAAALRKDSRRKTIDPLKANDELVAKLDAEAEEVARDIARDVERRNGRISPVKPSVGLRMAKDRMRRKGWNV